MRAGEVIDDRYRLVELAGQGGMGAVYRAVDLKNGAPVAVKVLRVAGPTDASSTDATRFRREARILAELRHDSVVGYHEHGRTADGEPYFAMEWLDGTDLSAHLKAHRGRLPPAEAIDVAVTAARALGAAHRRGIVHRDIKPSNLFLPRTRKPLVKVLDFGVASITGTLASTHQPTQGLLGTPGYMAPEQARGRGPVDARADVFSLGCVLFQCLSGKAPFVGDNLMALITKVLLDPIPRLSEVMENVPVELDDLVAKMMSRDPEDRPSNGQATAQLLAGLQLAGMSDARPASELLTETEQLLLWVVLAARDPSVLQHIHKPPASPAPKTLADADPLTLDPISSLVGQFGGLAELVGDGIVFIKLEGRRIATDQAAVAARCALALQALVGPISIAVAAGRGVSTQSAATASTLRDRRTSAASATAVAMLSRPGAFTDPRGTIALCETTRHLLGSSFVVSDDRLLHERTSVEGERKLLGRATPCVGRNRELRSLQMLFEECVTEPVTSAVLIWGPAGTGKSRLRQELLRRLRADGLGVPRPQEWYARGDEMSAGVAYELAGQLLRSSLNAIGKEDDDVLERRLYERLSSSDVLAESERERVLVFLRELLGDAAPASASGTISDETHPEIAAARTDPQLMADQIQRAFVDYVVSCAHQQPVVLVLEDLHWGDFPSTKLIDAVLRNHPDEPIFVVATARPDIDEAFPKLWEERRLERVRVSSLTKKAAAELVRCVLGSTLDRAQVDNIVAQAGGHPLHLEELIRVAIEGPLDGTAVPETVLAMVETRLRGLDATARLVLRAASVFGRAFWLDGVRSMLPGGVDIDDVIEHLEAQEIVLRQTTTRFGGHREVCFRQDTLREAAYGMLTDADRRAGHLIAARWLEAQGERTALVLARHYDLGDDPRSAAEHYVAAAEQALAADDLDGLMSAAQRALDLDGASHVKSAANGLLAEALSLRGSYPESLQHGALAAAQMERGSAPWVRVLGAMALSASKLGELDRLTMAARQLLLVDDDVVNTATFAGAACITQIHLRLHGRAQLADQLLSRLAETVTEESDAATRGHWHKAQSAKKALGGNPAASLPFMRQSIHAFQQAGDQRAACSLMHTQGWYAAELGALAEGERVLRDALPTAQRLGLHNLVAQIEHNLGLPLLRRGALSEAKTLEERCAQVFDEQGDARLLSGALGYLSWIARLEGDIEGARWFAKRAVDAAPSAPLQAAAYAFAAAADLAGDEPARALEHASRGFELLATSETTPEEGVTLLHWMRAASLRALGKADQAAEAAAEGYAFVMERAAAIDDLALRDAFLTRIEENAALIALAQPSGPDSPS